MFNSLYWAWKDCKNDTFCSDFCFCVDTCVDFFLLCQRKKSLKVSPAVARWPKKIAWHCFSISCLLFCNLSNRQSLSDHFYLGCACALFCVQLQHIKIYSVQGRYIDVRFQNKKRRKKRHWKKQFKYGNDYRFLKRNWNAIFKWAAWKAREESERTKKTVQILHTNSENLTLMILQLCARQIVWKWHAAISLTHPLSLAWGCCSCAYKMDIQFSVSFFLYFSTIWTNWLSSQYTVIYHSCTFCYIFFICVASGVRCSVAVESLYIGDITINYYTLCLVFVARPLVLLRFFVCISVFVFDCCQWFRISMWNFATTTNVVDDDENDQWKIYSPQSPFWLLKHCEIFFVFVLIFFFN